ncbi:MULTISPECIES: M10 family metallopeptidase C-terminal domain-containing protein [Phenylobacterium]|uniref:Peptidase metallopeptidase domain-containing protein n=1 Tax=Phenylobacterium koreense TaxID=266125 RepID=A0ABV2EPE5_9CAUL
MTKEVTPREAITLESGLPADPEIRYDASADPLAGGELRDLPIWTPEQIAEHLNRTGFEWSEKALSDGNLTYGFYDGPTTTGIYNNPHEAAETYGYAPMSEAQQEATREALAYWDDLIPIGFEERATGHGNWDISYATTTTGPAQAWAYLPHDKFYGAKYQHIEGDVWINPGPVSDIQLEDGFYGMQTLVHETGHALGLSHPGDYNASDDIELSYALADYYQDSRQYTVMSYWDSYETGARHIDWGLMRYVYSTTPLVHDVAAIQGLYGVDTTTRTGDTTYGFNWTDDLADRTAFQLGPNQLAPVFTIWDAGGVDTLDLSGYSTPSYIDLNPGSFSSAGGVEQFLSLEEINANNAAAGLPARSEQLYEVYNNGVEGINGGLSWREIVGATDPLMHDNISIAYGAVIENAIGGSGDDTIVGNDADNQLTGGEGADHLVFAADAGNDTVTDFAAGDIIDLSGIAGLASFADVQPLLSEDENSDAVLTLGSGKVVLTGVAVADLTAEDFLFA